MRRRSLPVLGPLSLLHFADPRLAVSYGCGDVFTGEAPLQEPFDRLALQCPVDGLYCSFGHGMAHLLTWNSQGLCQALI